MYRKARPLTTPGLYLHTTDSSPRGNAGRTPVQSRGAIQTKPVAGDFCGGFPTVREVSNPLRYLYLGDRLPKSSEQRQLFNRSMDWSATLADTHH